MNLYENPFYILGVSTRDTRQKIVEVCDVQSLRIDPRICSEARTTLITPKSRLAAEIAWLPGISPSRAVELIHKIKFAIHDVANSLPGLDPLARCNLVAEIIATADFKDPNNLSQWILYLANTFEKVDEASIIDLINEDREVSRFPLIQDDSVVSEEMTKHRSYLVSTMMKSLDRVLDPDKVLTGIVEQATSDGEEQAPILIEELIDQYQIKVRKYLDQVGQQVRTIISGIKSNPSGGIAKKIDFLEKALRNFDQISQPIQIIMQSKGMDDGYTLGLANEVRDLSLFLANEHGLHEESSRVTKLMIDFFKELPQFADRLAQDKAILDDIVNRKVKSREEEEKWRKEISLDIEIGKLFKDRLIITPEYISYRGERIRTEEVNRVRWGIFVQYTNGVKTGSWYTIWIGTSDKMFKVECSELLDRDIKKQERYSLILDKLWKAVCVRLIGETLSKLSSGEKIQYGDAVVDKNGILLKKRKLFGSDPFYSKWENLRISNGAGTFIIYSAVEEKARAELSYRDIDNVHILEAIIRFLWKDGNYVRLQRGEFR